MINKIVRKLSPGDTVGLNPALTVLPDYSTGEASLAENHNGDRFIIEPRNSENPRLRTLDGRSAGEIQSILVKE